MEADGQITAILRVPCRQYLVRGRRFGEVERDVFGQLLQKISQAIVIQSAGKLPAAFEWESGEHLRYFGRVHFAHACYLARNGTKSERRQVEVGSFNEEFIEVKNGVGEGDKVLLHPPKSLTPSAGDVEKKSAASESPKS